MISNNLAGLSRLRVSFIVAVEGCDPCKGIRIARQMLNAMVRRRFVLNQDDQVLDLETNELVEPESVN